MNRTEVRRGTPVSVLLVAEMLLSGCGSSAEGGDAAGGAGAGGGGGEGGEYVSPYAAQDAYCDPHGTKAECLENADAYCGWYDTTWRAPADSCDLEGPVGRCVYDAGADHGATGPGEFCPNAPELGRYLYRAAEPGWYDVVLLQGSVGIAFTRNGWSQCGIVEGIEQPPLCECLCLGD